MPAAQWGSGRPVGVVYMLVDVLILSFVSKCWPIFFQEGKCLGSRPDQPAPRAFGFPVVFSVVAVPDNSLLSLRPLVSCLQIAVASFAFTMSADASASPPRGDEGRAADLEQPAVDSVVGQKRPGSPLQSDAQPAGPAEAGPSGTAAAQTGAAAAERRSRKARRRVNRRNRIAALRNMPASAAVLLEHVDKIPCSPPRGQVCGGIPVEPPRSPSVYDSDWSERISEGWVLNPEYRVWVGGDAVQHAFSVRAPVMCEARASLVAAEALLRHCLPDWAAQYGYTQMQQRASWAFIEALVPCYGPRPQFQWAVFAADYAAGCLEAVHIMPVLPGVSPPLVPDGFVPVLRDYFSGPSLQAVVPAPAPEREGLIRLVRVYIPDSMLTVCFDLAAAYYSSL